jgi:glycosyltransferase involved in cell wall biosynthesis
MKKVSIIMPNYNHAPFLRERLDSIFAQDYTNKEVILLDDASTDESRTILNEYAARPEVKHVVLNDANSGNTFIQWEKGLSLATGDYIWIAESDDVADSRLVSRLVSALEQSDAMIAFAHSEWIDERGVVIPRNCDKQWSEDFVMDGVSFIKKYLLGYSHICNASAVLFRRSALSGVDMQHVQQYSASGDRLFWIALALQGKVTYIAEPLNRFRQHTHKVSGGAEYEGRNIIQDYSIYSSVAPQLCLSQCERRMICGYHWQAIHRSTVSALGREKAMGVWNAEPLFGRFSWWMYMLCRLKTKMIFR